MSMARRFTKLRYWYYSNDDECRERAYYTWSQGKRMGDPALQAPCHAPVLWKGFYHDRRLGVRTFENAPRTVIPQKAVFPI